MNDLTNHDSLVNTAEVMVMVMDSLHMMRHIGKLPNMLLHKKRLWMEEEEQEGPQERQGQTQKGGKKRGI